MLPVPRNGNEIEASLSFSASVRQLNIRCSQVFPEEVSGAARWIIILHGRFPAPVTAIPLSLVLPEKDKCIQHFYKIYTLMSHTLAMLFHNVQILSGTIVSIT